MSFDWKGTIRKLAPTLATALGGPLAGAATSAIATAILGRPDATEAEISQAMLSATPEQFAAIKKADQEFLVKMKELEIRVDELSFADVAGARSMAVARADNTSRNLSYFIVFMFFFVLAAQFAVGVSRDLVIDDTAQRTLDITTGILFTAFGAVMQFHFGTSKGAIVSNQSLRSIAEQK